MDGNKKRKRTALITGGAGGIGSEICQTLDDANYEVFSLDMQPCPVANAISLQGSVTDRETVEELLSWLQFDVLVNAAGITRDRFLHKMSYDEWDRVLDINLTGTFNVTRIVLPAMRTAKYGRIVNISSVNGCKGQMGQCNYAATKAGVHGFTMSLAQETARKNIMVNTISPGYIDTPMTQAIDADVRQTIVDSIPVQRMGTPTDISRTVLFLVDNTNTYITGANIPVNGGLYTSF